MKKNLLTTLLFIAIAFFKCYNPVVAQTANRNQLPQSVKKTNTQKLYVHYMAWFETPTFSGSDRWGQHWTMNNKNPNKILANGQREIASHYYPLIEPYASNDPDLIDYHIMLMKFSGIDGVIVDWNGTDNISDYPQIKKNTDFLFESLQKTNLKFAICYEDIALHKAQSIINSDINLGLIKDLTYLQDHFFHKKNYINVQQKPLLLCFGPQKINTPAVWDWAFSKLKQKPLLLSQANMSQHTGRNGSGEFAWIFPGHLQDLQNFYQYRAVILKNAIAAAYPGFKDYYKQGGWDSTLFFIDHNGIETLKKSLALAKTSGLDDLQIVSWNDFGEGSMIEPTKEFGFSFLETIQQYAGVIYTKKELELAFNWYQLRKKFTGNTNIQLQLTKAGQYLKNLEIKKAAAIINSLL